MRENYNPPTEFTCERCGETFIKPFWFIKKGRRFCSAACKTKDPMKTMMQNHRKEENGCWTWTGFLDEGGYGQIKTGGKSQNTHRLMWILHNKQEPPEGQVVRHTCVGNRACINPDHLILGTPYQNVHDCIDQGRFPVAPKGEANHSSKLTEAQVREMIALRNPQDGSKPLSYHKMAKRFGVSYTACYLAVKGINWKHLQVGVDKSVVVP